MSVAFTWGSTPDERAGPFPGEPPDASARIALWRGVDVEAPPPVVFRWLCQLRVAPYSYDWIDNLGRTSPRVLLPGLEALEIGQRFMTIFRLVAFEPEASITLETPARSGGARLFGTTRVTYWCRPAGGRDTDGAAPARTRLLAKLWVLPPPGLLGVLVRRGLPWGDLVMMRRQLLNLRSLAEQTARAGRSHR